MQSLKKINEVKLKELLDVIFHRKIMASNKQSEAKGLNNECI